MTPGDIVVLRAEMAEPSGLGHQRYAWCRACTEPHALVELLLQEIERLQSNPRTGLALDS